MDRSQELLGRVASAEKLLHETPLLQLADERLDLYTKLEFLNGIGSIKDRPAFWILATAINAGQIGPESTIIESSSGNFACALATFCRVLKLDFIPVVDPLISPLYESYLRSQCRRIVKVDKRDDTGGYLKTRLAVVRSLLDETPGSYWPNQYENPAGMAAHYKLTAAEICKALPTVDYIFIGVSSAGTIAGISRRLKEHNPRIRIIAVDAEGSVIFGQPPQKRHIPGIGSSIVPPLLKEALIDEIMIVPEQDTISACHKLLECHGLFVGGSTGSAYSAIQSYFAGKTIAGRPKVLFLCCDRGTAYLHSIFNPNWVYRHRNNYSAEASLSMAK